MQFQADILNLPVIRPVTRDATTALGCAYAAGLAVSHFKDLEDLRANWAVDHTWKPNMTDLQRQELYNKWKRAVSKSFDWQTDHHERCSILPNSVICSPNSVISNSAYTDHRKAMICGVERPRVSTHRKAAGAPS